MKYIISPILFLVVFSVACSTVPGREITLRSIAIRRASDRFTKFTKCEKVKLYKIKRINGTAGNRYFQFRIGGCNTAMEFFVRCVKWNHTCPEGKMLSFVKGKSHINMEPLFKKLPLSK